MISSNHLALRVSSSHFSATPPPVWRSTTAIRLRSPGMIFAKEVLFSEEVMSFNIFLCRVFVGGCHASSGRGIDKYTIHGKHRTSSIGKSLQYGTLYRYLVCNVIKHFFVDNATVAMNVFRCGMEVLISQYYPKLDTAVPPSTCIQNQLYFIHLKDELKEYRNHFVPFFE